MKLLKSLAAAMLVATGIGWGTASAGAVELCAALDGSGSLSTADFTLQLEGLAAAVEDPTIVPRNGSVSLSVVIFEWGAQVAVPATVIDSEDAAVAIAAAVRAIPWRFGHRTDMVAAVEQCVGQFRDPADRWVIDVSTDGRHSQTLGTDPLAARDAAVTVGLDVLNALGVGDADQEFLGRFVWPQPASAFPADGFVIYIPDFEAYVEVMREKVRAELALTVGVDVKPGSCDNPFNVESKGVLPVAILGGPELEAAAVDPASVRLAGVAPLRWSYEDTTGPAGGGTAGSCGTCAAGGPDGWADLVLHFDSQQVAAALGAVADGECRQVNLSGTLLPEGGGGAIAGRDVLLVIMKK